MLGILGGDERCPIARSLDVLGEKWTLMIVRDAFIGETRFGGFQRRLGIPREVLAARLGSLVEGGVLERVAYKADGERSRDEYVLTDAGRDLAPVLLAMGEWADRHRPPRRPSDLRFVDGETTEPIGSAAVVVETGRAVPRERIAVRVDRHAGASVG